MSYTRFVMITLLVSLLIVIINFMILEVFTRKVLIPNDVVQREEAMLLAAKEHVKIISIGDSHANAGIFIDRPTYFNFASDGEPTPIWYFKTKWALKNLKQLEYILLPLDYHIFSHYRTVDVEPVTRQFAKYIDEKVEPKLGIYPVPNSASQFTLHSQAPNYASIAHRALWKYWRKDFQPPALTSVGGSLSHAKFTNMPEGERRRTARSRVRVHLHNHLLVNEALLDYYQRVINLAQERGVKVVLVRYPLSNEYLTLIDSSVDERIDKVIRQLESKYHLPILDYRFHFKQRQDCFVDEDHLNLNGATLLGEKMVEDLKGVYEDIKL